MWGSDVRQAELVCKLHMLGLCRDKKEARIDRGNRAQAIMHLTDQVLVPNILSARADGPAVDFAVGAGNSTTPAEPPASLLHMEYPPVPRDVAVREARRSASAATSLASLWAAEESARAAGGAPGPAAYGRVGWGGPLTASAGRTDTGLQYSVTAAAPAPAPTPGLL